MAIIEGIRVTVYKKVGVGEEMECSFVGSDLTDETGDFSIGGLAAGTYRLKFSSPDDTHLTEYYNDKESLETATDIVVTAAETVTGKDAVLGLSGFIEGNVTDT